MWVAWSMRPAWARWEGHGPRYRIDPMASLQDSVCSYKPPRVAPGAISFHPFGAEEYCRVDWIHPPEKEGPECSFHGGCMTEETSKTQEPWWREWPHVPAHRLGEPAGTLLLSLTTNSAMATFVGTTPTVITVSGKSLVWGTDLSPPARPSATAPLQGRDQQLHSHRRQAGGSALIPETSMTSTGTTAGWGHFS